MQGRIDGHGRHETLLCLAAQPEQVNGKGTVMDPNNPLEPRPADEIQTRATPSAEQAERPQPRLMLPPGSSLCITAIDGCLCASYQCVASESDMPVPSVCFHTSGAVDDSIIEGTDGYCAAANVYSCRCRCCLTRGPWHQLSHKHQVSQMQYLCSVAEMLQTA